MRQDSSRAGFVIGVQLAAALLMAQQIAGKAARDGLFLLHHGPDALPGMVAGSAGFSIVLSLLSGQLLRRLAPRVVAPWGIGASGVLLLVEGWLLGVRPGVASVLIYLHIAGVGAVLLSTFWSMLNEEFDPREAKKNFGRIAAGGTVGGLVGGLAAERTVAWFGAPGLMLLMAILHLAAGVFIAVLMAKGAPARGPAAAIDPPKARGEAPHRSALLRTLAGIVLLGAFGAALLDYVFKVYVTASFGRGADLLRFFAFFHAGVAVSSFVLQSAGAKLVLEKFGLGTTALTLPATLGGGSFLTLLAPGAGLAIFARAAEAAVRGSLFRAGYETAYTPVPDADKRVAKAFIDVAAERAGDALGAAAVYLCLLFAGISAPPWILSIAALAGFASALLCLRLDQVYVGTLARSLEARAVQLSLDSDLDLTTRTVMMRAPTIRAGLTETWREPSLPATGEDAVLERLAALRSSDPRRVQSALRTADLSDPLLAAQVCLLLQNSQFAPWAQSALMAAPEKVLGLLTDFLLNHSLDVGVRRMLPRIIASAGGPRAADCLVTGLQDNRFEVRLQCARSLAKTWAKLPSFMLPDKILAAVDRELAIGANLWESHRRQQTESGEEWLDELLRDKAHGSLEYVFTLLSLLHERAPLMAAFRSLHLDDRRLRGTAIEYLEGILPPKTREKLWDILQEHPSKAPAKQKSEIMQELMNASETVVLRLREQRSPGPGRAG
jgi:ATP:ADP antiporter, AAA family